MGRSVMEGDSSWRVPCQLTANNSAFNRLCLKAELGILLHCWQNSISNARLWFKSKFSFLLKQSLRLERKFWNFHLVLSSSLPKRSHLRNAQRRWMIKSNHVSHSTVTCRTKLTVSKQCCIAAQQEAHRRPPQASHWSHQQHTQRPWWSVGIWLILLCLPINLTQNSALRPQPTSHSWGLPN